MRTAVTPEKIEIYFLIMIGDVGFSVMLESILRGFIDFGLSFRLGLFDGEILLILTLSKEEKDEKNRR